MKGRFITFEGTEGCGKSTQITALQKRLSQLGHSALCLREPGGTPIGEEIRHLLKHSDRNAAMTAEAELLLINASRAQLVREVIRPALAEGKVVLCDRFFDSTLAYQAYGRGLDLAAVESVVEFAADNIRPDLTLWLDLPYEIGEQRRLQRNQGQPRDRFEEESSAFFARVEEGFRELAAKDPARIHRVDAAGSPEQVAGRVWNAVVNRFPKDFGR